MKVMTRGIPNFSYTSTQEVDNLEAFIASHTLKVSRFLDVRAEYHQPETGKRVMLYIEGVEENRATLERLCYAAGRSSMRSLTCKVHENGWLRQSGTTSYLHLNEGLWYMVDPKLDSRFPAALEDLKVRDRGQRRLILIEQEKEDALREQVDDLVCNLGLNEALRRLKGE